MALAAAAAAHPFYGGRKFVSERMCVNASERKVGANESFVHYHFARRNDCAAPLVGLIVRGSHPHTSLRPTHYYMLIKGCRLMWV